MSFTATPAEIRTWAKANGVSVGARGRLSAVVTETFYKAHTPTGKPRKSKAA